MTTIAAVQGPSWAVIGADSQVSEDTKKYRLPASQSKLVSNRGYLFGIAGELRAVNLLACGFDPPQPGKTVDSIESLDVFMIRTFIPKLRACFASNEYGKDGEHGATIIASIHGVLYEIGSSYECMRDSGGLYAIGTGDGYALGAMHAIKDMRSRTMAAARDMVKAGIHAAAQYDSCTSEPITIWTQSNKE